MEYSINDAINIEPTYGLMDYLIDSTVVVYPNNFIDNTTTTKKWMTMKLFLLLALYLLLALLLKWLDNVAEDLEKELKEDEEGGNNFKALFLWYFIFSIYTK